VQKLSQVKFGLGATDGPIGVATIAPKSDDGPVGRTRFSITRSSWSTSASKRERQGRFAALYSRRQDCLDLEAIGRVAASALSAATAGAEVLTDS